MTQEQIKQNAEEYAKKHYDIPFEDDSSMNVIVSEESYIEGAHSRDVEVEQLKAELAKAQNPWIPLAEQVPPPKERVIFRDIKGSVFFGQGQIDGEHATIQCSNDDIPLLTHWMPIPQAPKGGEA